ncbi:MAG TPA: (2Fe-2S)-binding protein [Micromonosporaceae bacterium]|nr:(2Fe-2S)-binding protein [Micromonosporaceae bacterium]
MYVCICARVRDCELRAVIRRGAHSDEAIGEACGAGTGCGTCHQRIDEVVQETLANTLVSADR